MFIHDTNDSTIERPTWLGQELWPFTPHRHEHRNAGGESMTIHYTDEGTGPTLVFVHAGMWSFVWRDVIRRLRSSYRCITLDFPGTGLSGGSTDDIDLARYPQIVDEVLVRCGVDEATFVVHDLGGVVGVLAAAMRPELTTGLVVANSFAWAPQQRALRTMLRVMGSRFAIGTMGTMRVIPRLSRTRAGVGRHLGRPDRAAFFGPYRRRRASRNFHRAMRSASRSAAMFDRAETALRGPLARLPVMTIFGEKNDQFGFADRWEMMFPTLRRWTVEGGNHFPMCDAPDDFCRWIDDWHTEVVRLVSQDPIGRLSRHGQDVADAQGIRIREFVELGQHAH